MYYRLKDKYCLRGWDLLPYAIVDSETHRAHFVDKAEFDALTLCDGTVDLALPLISQDIRDSAAKLEAQGYITPCAPGAGLAGGSDTAVIPTALWRAPTGPSPGAVTANAGTAFFLRRPDAMAS